MKVVIIKDKDGVFIKVGNYTDEYGNYKERVSALYNCGNNIRKQVKDIIIEALIDKLKDV